MTKHNFSKTAFITGSTGFLGNQLCQQLLENNWHVTALCRKTPVQAHNGMSYVQGDILDHQSLLNTIPHSTQFLFHTAASTSTWKKNNKQQTLTNILGTANVIKACQQQNVGRMIHTSSIVSYGVDHAGLVDVKESNLKEGINSWVNYVKSKSVAEQLVHKACQDDGLDAVIINPGHIIGPGDRHNWVRLFKMVANDSLPTIPQGAGSFVDVRDVARGMIAVAQLGKSSENYILGGNNTDFETFIDQLAMSLQVNITKRHVPQSMIKMVANIKSWLSYITNKEPDITPESLKIISHQYRTDSQKAKDELAYTITEMQTTINDTIAFMRTEKLI
ncbi:MAG: NAD-dependent epimerase/dehydratase family protein [Proteobacteria bacterium]|nr:NAD-dependent epimerase/dehydratase family protein [Pseudomonadota bacterium]